MPDRVTIEKFAELSGYTKFAIRTKIARGVWREREVWFRAPDGRILISNAGYDIWTVSLSDRDIRTATRDQPQGIAPCGPLVAVSE